MTYEERLGRVSRVGSGQRVCRLAQQAADRRREQKASSAGAWAGFLELG